MNNSQFPVARKSGLVIQEVPDELLVYDLDNNKAHCLNKTAALVWKSCDGSNSVADIARIIEKQAAADAPDDLVWLAIDQLSENNLLEKELRANFGTSRREAIKKIGMATMIGLPIIASLVSPGSAFGNVSSCQNCTTNGVVDVQCVNANCGHCCVGGACVPEVGPVGSNVCPSPRGTATTKSK